MGVVKPRRGLGFVLALVLVASVSNGALAAPPPGDGADVTVSVAAPPSTPLVGATFQLLYTVTNEGPASAGDAYFSDYLSAELELESVESSDSGDTCSADQPVPEAYPPGAAPDSGGGGSVGSPGSPGYDGGGGGIYCQLGNLAAGEQTKITMTLHRIGARETYNSAYIGASTPDPDYNDNYADLYMEADMSAPADVGATIDGPSSPEVASNFTYRFKITNNGPSTTKGANVANPIPYGAEFVSVDPVRDGDTCSTSEAGWSSGYPELSCDFAPIASGASAAVDVVVTRSSAYEVWISAWARTGNYDSNYDNDYASFAIPADPSVTSDIKVVARGPLEVPLVGETFPLELRVRNLGPSGAGDVWVSDYLPPGVDFVSVTPSDTCSYNSYGGYPIAEGPVTDAPQARGDAYYPIYQNGVYCSVGALPAGEVRTIVISVTRTNARETWNSAWASSSNFDPNYENNYGDLLIGPDKSHPADVGVSMTAPDGAPVGESFDYKLKVTNHGPSTATDVMLGDWVPWEVEFKEATSTDEKDVCSFVYDQYYPPQPYESSAPYFWGSRELQCDLGEMASGESATITLSVARTSPYEIWNSAWVTAANYDDNWENDYDSVLVDGKKYWYGCDGPEPYAGTGESDTIIVGDCPVAAGAGADSITASPSSGGDARVASGDGRDTIDVNLTNGGAERRRIVVHGGRGADEIALTAATGRINATVLIYGDGGADSIDVFVPPGVSGLRVVIRGRGGNDKILWTRPSTGGALSRGAGMTSLGGAGNDLLQGGDRNDVLGGGTGRDRLYGGLGRDSLNGGTGLDVCRGGPGADDRASC
jgi:uncharacterized repeat protein (TIGR01451 family)